MEPRAAAARELLLAALEDLSQEQLRRFRHKLRDAPLDGRSIPWGRLEGADAVDLAEQLTHFYGPEPALDVARKTLKRADVRDVAARLKQQRLQRERGAGAGGGRVAGVPAPLSPRTWAESRPGALGGGPEPPRRSAWPHRGSASLSGLGASPSALLSVSGRSAVPAAGPREERAGRRAAAGQGKPRPAAEGGLGPGRGRPSPATLGRLHQSTGRSTASTCCGSTPR